MGSGRRSAQRIGRRALGHRPLAVNRLPKGVHNPALPGQGWPHHGTVSQDVKFRAGGDALYGAKRHEQSTVFAKADHLGNQGLGAAAINLDPSADRQARQAAANLDQEAIDRGHPPVNLERINPFDSRDQAIHGNS